MSDIHKPKPFDESWWTGYLDTKLPGWMSIGEARFLHNEIAKYQQPSVYVEIGVAHGKSFQLVQHHKSSNMEMTGFDITNQGHNLPNVRFEHSLRAARTWDKEIDVLFIDGDHTHHGVMNDILSWWHHVKPGGSIVFHDYRRPDRDHVGVTTAANTLIPVTSNFRFTEYICAMTKP